MAIFNCYVSSPEGTNSFGICVIHSMEVLAHASMIRYDDFPNFNMVIL